MSIEFNWVERADQAIQRCSLAIDANPSNAKAYFRTDREPLCHESLQNQPRSFEDSSQFRVMVWKTIEQRPNQLKRIYLESLRVLVDVKE